MTKTEFQNRAAAIADQCIAYSTRRLGREITRLYNDHLRPAGINVAEMNLLVAVGSVGEAQPVQLADSLRMEKSTLSRNITRLSTRGWVHVRDNDRGRGDLVSLTTEGEKALEAAIPYWQAAQVRARALVEDHGISPTP